jgi:hypothetical protein
VGALKHCSVSWVRMCVRVGWIGDARREKGHIAASSRLLIAVLAPAHAPYCRLCSRRAAQLPSRLSSGGSRTDGQSQALSSRILAATKTITPPAPVSHSARPKYLHAPCTSLRPPGSLLTRAQCGGSAAVPYQRTSSARSTVYGPPLRRKTLTPRPLQTR